MTPPTNTPRRLKTFPDVESADTRKFRGDVRVEHVGTSELKLLRVSFKRGARTAVHRHDSEQWLYFLEGRGFVQHVDDHGHPAKLELAEAGETILTPLGVWHHHGAVEGQATVHLSITRDGPPNDDNWRYGQFLPSDLPRESDDDRLP